MALQPWKVHWEPRCGVMTLMLLKKSRKLPSWTKEHFTIGTHKFLSRLSLFRIEAFQSVFWCRRCFLTVTDILKRDFRRVNFWGGVKGPETCIPVKVLSQVTHSPGLKINLEKKRKLLNHTLVVRCRLFSVSGLEPFRGFFRSPSSSH